MKNKAQELVDNYKIVVYPYRGSSTLTNTEFEDLILYNARMFARILVEELLKESGHYQDIVSVWQDGTRNYSVVERLQYWKKVLKDIDKTV